ncbi:hypothetical protein HPB52_025370 [Rhipicephalus sanguineus]|uniref:Uncharacterized protein n=1 Tax=Rhipicephalus sanguineus TaxID=34632 RepID=A0A9D4YRE3_RHISA|nr:hypothetical protein HPB52_025370 [Rhipicephalus sanguineus]
MFGLRRRRGPGQAYLFLRPGPNVCVRAVAAVDALGQSTLHTPQGRDQLARSHGLIADGCDRPCRRCGDGHPTVVCPVRRSYSDAATGAFPPLKPASVPTTDSGDVEEVTDAVLASPLRVPSNEVQDEGSIADATPCASASPPMQEACASEDAAHCPANDVGVPPTPSDAMCTNELSSRAAAVGVTPARPVLQNDSAHSSGAQENIAASSVAATPTTSTPRRTRKKSPARKVLTPARRDVDSAATIEDVDPSLPAAQPLPPQDTSSEDSFSLGLDGSTRLSSLGEFDVEMEAPREIKRGHTSTSCSDEVSDGRAEAQRPKNLDPLWRVELCVVTWLRKYPLDTFRDAV